MLYILEVKNAHQKSKILKEKAMQCTRIIRSQKAIGRNNSSCCILLHYLYEQLDKATYVYTHTSCQAHACTYVFTCHSSLTCKYGTVCPFALLYKLQAGAILVATYLQEISDVYSIHSTISDSLIVYTMIVPMHTRRYEYIRKYIYTHTLTHTLSI